MSQTREKIQFLDKISRDAPEYREILSVFRELYSVIDGRENDTGITFEPVRQHDAAKLGGGFPLLTREDLRIDLERLTTFLSMTIDVILAVGREGGEGLAAMKQALSEGRYDLAALIGACFARERAPLEDAAGETGVPSPLLEFVVGTALKTALQCFTESVEPTAFDGWKESYCPVCGGRAGMAELAGEEGRRFLCCSACFFRWPFPRIKCPYCGEHEPDSLSYFQVGEEITRVDVCKKCSRYIKTRDSRKGNGDVPLEAEDLVTLHLDLLAVREGFERGK